MNSHAACLRRLPWFAKTSLVQRAAESLRIDAVVEDWPARFLAEKLARAGVELPESDSNRSWPVIVRTCLIDRAIGEQVSAGVRTIVSIGCGLDTRPYRLRLPFDLRWIEIDRPEIHASRASLLHELSPRCGLERIDADPTDWVQLDGLLDRIDLGQNVLFVAEAHLVLLSDDSVAALLKGLARRQSVERGIVDVVSPGLLERLRWNPSRRAGDPAPTFAPPNGPDYFMEHGWMPTTVKSILRAAVGLNRLPVELRAVADLPEDPVTAPFIPWAGVCVLQKVG